MSGSAGGACAVSAPGRPLSSRQPALSGVLRSDRRLSHFDDAVQDLFTILGKENHETSLGAHGAGDFETEIKVRVCLENLLHSQVTEAHRMTEQQQRQESFHRRAQDVQHRRAVLMQMQVQAQSVAREQQLREREERCASLEKALELKERELTEQRKVLARQLCSDGTTDSEARSSKAPRTASAAPALCTLRGCGEDAASAMTSAPMTAAAAAILQALQGAIPSAPTEEAPQFSEGAAAESVPGERALLLPSAAGDRTARIGLGAADPATGFAELRMPRPLHLPAPHGTTLPSESAMSASTAADGSNSIGPQATPRSKTPLSWLTAPIAAWRAKFSAYEDEQWPVVRDSSGTE